MLFLFVYICDKILILYKSEPQRSEYAVLMKKKSLSVKTLRAKSPKLRHFLQMREGQLDEKY